MIRRRLRVAVVGYGYWGPNLARVFAAAPGADLVAVCDSNTARAELAMRTHCTARAYQRPELLFSNRGVDAVAIATPVSTHYPLVRAALEQGKHVLVTKPLAASVEEAEELAALAEKHGRVLMVDHTFCYTAAVRKMRELVDDLGNFLYYDAVRVNLGLFQHDADVIWDLAPHDLSILLYVLGSGPTAVACTASDLFGTGKVDVAYLTLYDHEAVWAHLHVSWLSPVKVRRVTLIGDKKALVYDDLEPSEKVRVYARGVEFEPLSIEKQREGLYRALVGYRLGDGWTPYLDNREALAAEAEHFTAVCRGKEEPCEGADAHAGVAVVKLLAAASRSAAAEGAKVSLADESAYDPVS